MTDGYLLAIDVGTGSARAVLFTADGRQVGIGQREYSHKQAPGVPDSQVFDTAANWSLIGAVRARGLGRRADLPAAIRAVSASSMREGMVLYDARRAGDLGLPECRFTGGGRSHRARRIRARHKRSTAALGTGSRSPPPLVSAGSPGTSRTLFAAIAARRHAR